MSDVTLSGIDLLPIELLPHQIHTQPRYNVRPFSTEACEEEDKRIESLAEAIEAIGQIDSLLITPGHVLIAGHRRRRAGLLINERRAARGESLLKLRCNIDRSTGDLRRKSILSNTQRREISPMDLAYLITQIRREYGWEGQGGNARVCEYLKIDHATRWNCERFMSVEKTLQHQIHKGIISAQSAMHIIRELENPAERAALIDRAGIIQQEDRLEKALDDFASGRKTATQATSMIQTTPERIERPAIVKAIRERRNGTPNTHLPLTRAELLDAILDLARASDGPAADFVFYFADVFAKGQGNKRDLKAKFQSLVKESRCQAVAS